MHSPSPGALSGAPWTPTRFLSSDRPSGRGSYVFQSSFPPANPLLVTFFHGARGVFATSFLGFARKGVFFQRPLVQESAFLFHSSLRTPRPLPSLSSSCSQTWIFFSPFAFWDLDLRKETRRALLLSDRSFRILLLSPVRGGGPLWSILFFGDLLSRIPLICTFFVASV